MRTDDLGAVPLRALMAKHPNLDWAAIDDVLYGCANQAGEDNRNVARMALLLAGLPQGIPVPPSTACAAPASMRWAPQPARSRRARRLMIAGGVESMSRAPFVMPKAESAFSVAMRCMTPPSAGASSTS